MNFILLSRLLLTFEGVNATFFLGSFGHRAAFLFIALVGLTFSPTSTHLCVVCKALSYVFPAYVFPGNSQRLTTVFLSIANLLRRPVDPILVDLASC